jgi:hypothetical protein
VSKLIEGVPTRDHSLRSFAMSCPECHEWTEVSIGTPAVDLPHEVTCGRCGHTGPVDFATHYRPEAVLDGCPLCDYHTLYIQKDVNAKLGVLLVVVTFGALLLSGMPLTWMVGCLVLLALVDWWLLRRWIRRVLICYRCKAQFRGFPPGPSCRPFDLATWEAHDTPTAG